jgi:hypothetical protein
MSDSPRHGATDPNGKVWGTDRVYVTDASLHVTNGGANPVLTVTAFAARRRPRGRHRVTGPAADTTPATACGGRPHAVAGIAEGDGHPRVTPPRITRRRCSVSLCRPKWSWSSM